MWLIVAFDLPVEDSVQKKAYRLFLKTLRNLGFIQAQRSVYWRWGETQNHSEVIVKRLKEHLPDCGNISIFKLPAHIFKNIESFDGKTAVPVPSPPSPWQII